MSRYNCASCSACKGINKSFCDNCTACCCQDNMKKHREIFYLGDQFPSKVNNAESELKSRADQVQKNLYGNYNIYISECRCCLDHCENFLNAIKNRYNEMDRKKYDLDFQIQRDRQNFEIDKGNLSNDFNQRLRYMNDSFENEKRTIRNEREKENEKIKPLKKTIENLENEIEKIKKINVDEIVNKFVSGEKNKIEADCQSQKNRIDEENKLKEEILEYTEEEKNLESDYLKIINGIKKYSNKIPYFDNWIEVYKLKKYIN